MKKIFLIICVVLASLQLRAEDSIPVSAPRPDILDEMPNVEVIQAPAIAILLDMARNNKHEYVEIDGYRVQIFSSNQQQTAKAQALELEANLKASVNQTIYVQYLPPFWKVRIGDFRTVEEAKEYKKLFVQQFPDMIGETYVVRDKIKVLQ
jgi:hypothetical protein